MVDPVIQNVKTISLDANNLPLGKVVIRMFKKVTMSKKTDYKQCSTYKEQISYHDRLKKSLSIDLKDNSNLIDFGNGFSQLEPKCDKNTRSHYSPVIFWYIMDVS